MLTVEPFDRLRQHTRTITTPSKHIFPIKSLTRVVYEMTLLFLKDHVCILSMLHEMDTCLYEIDIGCFVILNLNQNFEAYLWTSALWFGYIWYIGVWGTLRDTCTVPPRRFERSIGATGPWRWPSKPAANSTKNAVSTWWQVQNRWIESGNHRSRIVIVFPLAHDRPFGAIVWV